MTRENLLYKLTGTETPKFITKRENEIINKCLNIINELESEVKKLNKSDVSGSLPSAMRHNTPLKVVRKLLSS